MNKTRELLYILCILCYYILQNKFNKQVAKTVG